MKSLVEFLSDLRGLSITLSVNGERLVCNAPKSAVTDEIRKELTRRKADILVFLRDAQTLPISERTEIAQEEIPLSHSQQRLWFVTQLDSQDPVYNVVISLWLNGELNRDALERSLLTIVKRHESLRTGFFERNGQPFAKVLDAPDWKMTFVDLSHLASREDGSRTAEAEAERLARIEFRRPFNLEKPPLFRATLLEVSPRRALLALALHHIVADGWSVGILSHELTELYAAFAGGQPSSLVKLPFQFRDYVQWEQDAGEKAARRQMPYWLERLKGELPVLELPADRPRPLAQTFNGRRISIAIDEILAQRIRDFSRETGTTVFMVLLAAFQSLLFRYTGLEDILVGSGTSNRSRQEFSTLIGFFVNNLVLRNDLSGNPSFSELLKRIQETATTAYAHQDVPFERLVEILQPERSLSRSPLVQVMFTFQNLPMPELCFPGLAVEIARIDPGTARAELSVEVWPENKGYRCDFEYNTDLFDERTIRQMQTHYVRFLEAAITDPSLPIERVPLLSQSERDRLLYEWNDTKIEFADERCIHELFEEQAAKTPEAIALVFEEDLLSYRELNSRANQLAHYLLQLGMKPDARVAICVERSLEMVVGMLAVVKAGGAYVPLDPTYPVDRLKFMLEDSVPVALLTQARLHETFSGLSHALPVLDLDAIAPPWSNQSHNNLNPASIGLNPQHLAYVIYTSGSTGQPKGVMVEHRGLCNRIIWMQRAYELDAEDAVLQKTPFSFDVSIWEFFWPIVVGAKLVMARPEGHKDAIYLYRAIQHNKITTVHFVPSMLWVFLEQGGAAACSSLKNVICSGEALPGLFAQRFQEQLPNAALHNLYGPTETTVDVTAWTCPPGLSQDNIPIGRPIANTKIYILDTYGEPVPIGVAGELYIAGVGVARGYLNRPDLTKQRFVPDPFAATAGARMYKTGDLARRLADGDIEFLGRNDFQVKIRGFRIELGEIEARLAEYPAVREAAVIAREDTPGDKRLVAYYTVADTNTLEEVAPEVEEMRRHLAAKLPGYMAPAAYVRLESLPLTPNGKLDRKALPAPEADAYALRGYAAPQGETETALAAIWADVLKLDQVGRHDNFFELGGHSLLAVTLADRMRRGGFEVDVRALFVTPTVAGLTASIGGNDSTFKVPANRIPSGCAAITPEMLPLLQLTPEEIERIVSKIPGGAANVQDIYPLAPLQEGILFHYLMGGKGDPYLLSGLFSFDSRARLDDYTSALQAVIGRHDILRTAVIWEGLPEAVQAVCRNASLPVEEVLLDPAAGEASEQLYARFDPRQFRIDIRQAPLLRLYIARDLSRGRWLGMLLLHHLAGDHVTLEVMQEEVQAHLMGEAGRLPAPFPFRNLVAQARLGMSQEEHEIFFRKMLGGVEETTAPFGLLDVQGDGAGIEQAHMAVDRDLARRLRKRARKLGVSAATLCHVAWAQVLAKVSGREDVVFGTVVFGRMQGGRGAGRAMGLFINTLPVLIRIGEEGAEASVRRTHALLGELMRHEHASLALAQRCSGAPGSVPLFSALLNYRHSAGAAQTVPVETGWEGVEVLYAEERTNYPFSLSVDDLGEDFALTAQVQAPAEPGRVCGYMHAALASLVQALETSPATPVRNLEVLPEAELRQVVEVWNRTDMRYPSEQCVHELFEEQVRRRPQAVAVVFEDASLTYAELNARANRLAHFLRRLGVRPDARVAVCVERGFEMIVALLATLKAGGAYVPLDPAYPGERLRYMLEDSAPVALLTQSHLKTQLSAGSQTLPVLDMAAAAPAWKDQPETDPDRAGVGLTSKHLAYVIYTSGSTGVPKGVAIEHRSLSNLIHWHTRAFDLKWNQRSSSVAAFGFDAATWEIWPALCVGASLALPPPTRTSDPEALLDWWVSQKLDVSFLPTPIAELALARGEVNPHLHTLLIGGDHLRHCPVKTLPFALVNNYGPAEATVVATSGRIELSGSVLSVGRPIANTRIYILDAYGQPVPAGVAGELYIGGAGVARGYLNRPEQTAERFSADPFADQAGARMYRSGDLGRWLKDGSIEFLGRNDLQVKIRGFRIELGEIEARLLETAGIRQAVVIAREDTPGDKRLVAYYTVADTNTLEEVAPEVEEMRRHLAAKLPKHMAPAAYVRLESLPLTPNGKLDRKALPAPEADAYALRGYAAPQGESETALAAIWADVLKLDQVGRHDNFFELGGHSLLAVTLADRMRRGGFEVDVRAIFVTPTVAELAASIGGDTSTVDVPANRIPSGCAAITPEMLPLLQLTPEEIERIVSKIPGGAANVQDIYPLAPLQEGILFHYLMGGKGDPYLLSGLFSFDSRARLDDYTSALQAVIGRHDILRTAVIWEGLPEAVQAVCRNASLPVEEVLLDPAAGEASEQLYARFDPRQFRIDIRQAPLLRLYIARDLSRGRWLGMLLLHHLAGDHVTLEVMQEEVQAHLMGEAGRLPAPFPFRNLVAQARLGMSQEEHEIFFRKMLGGVEETTAPFGLLDVQGDGAGIEQAHMAVDRDLARRLRKRARKLGVSAATLCHVAWAQVLAKVSGREDVVFGTVVFGRMQGGRGAGRAMGLFINTLPVLIRIGEEGAEASVRRTHALLGELMRHEHASLALAQRCSGAPGSVPLFSALLNYRHSAGAAQTVPVETGWEGVEVLYAEERTNYPFSLSVDDLGEDFALTAQVQAPAEPGRVCGYMHAALASLVQALETSPATPVRNLEVLPEAELRQVFEEGEHMPSRSQQRLWFLDQLSPGSAVYNIPTAVRLTGNLPRRTLELALKAVLARHESLRTSFLEKNGMPYAKVENAEGWEMQYLDFSGLAPHTHDDEIKRYVEREAGRPFALDKGPLFRASLIRTAPEEHTLITVVHHIVFDGWSIGLLAREVVAFYEALEGHKDPALPALRLQFRDFAAWEQQQPETAKGLQMGYWKKQLAGELPLLDLPTDRQRPAVQSFNGDHSHIVIPRQLAARLQRLSREQNATLFMVLFAAFNVLLLHYSHQEDILVGTPTAGRLESDFEHLIGFFVNNLVLRTDLGGDPTFAELIRRVRKTALEAFEYQGVPFDQIVEELQPERGLDRSPIFQVLFTLQNLPVQKIHFAGLEMSAFEFQLFRARYDLAVDIYAIEEGYRCDFEYSTDLFDKDTVQQMLRHYLRLLEAVAADPGRPIGSLPLLNEAEYRLIVENWNRTERPSPGYETVTEWFRAQAADTPGAIAVAMGEQALSYVDLDRQSDRLAGALRERGVRRESVVGLYVTRGLNMVVGLLAILKAGGAYLPLDPAFPAERIEFLLSDAGVPLILTETSLKAALMQTDATLLAIDQAWDDSPIAGVDSPFGYQGQRPEADDLAYLIYTSGSTGKPKGTEITHGALVNLLSSMLREPGLRRQDTLIAVTTLSFDITGLEIFGPLVCGAKLILASREQALDPHALAGLLEQAGGTVMQATPSTWRMLVESGWTGKSDLRIWCGGEALPPELADSLLARGRELWNLYGPTETTIWSAAHRVTAGDGQIVIGRPIANTQMYILDAQGRPAPIGVAGELYIAGAGVARGYWKRPDLTQTRFVPDPFSKKANSRMYRTGDLARYRRDGQIQLLGRTDHQIKLRGHRIELGEIEAVIERHAQVQQAVVALDGQGAGERLIAYVKQAEEAPVNDLRGWLQQRLPEYMVPSTFVSLRELPLTPNGKVDRKRLPAPDETVRERAAVNVVPRNQLERTLARIWSDVLRVGAVGVRDNFFDLGGQSLLLIKVHAKLRREIDADVPVVDLFRYPTIESMAAHLDRRRQAAVAEGVNS